MARAYTKRGHVTHIYTLERLKIALILTMYIGTQSHFLRILTVTVQLLMPSLYMSQLDVMGALYP